VRSRPAGCLGDPVLPGWLALLVAVLLVISLVAPRRGRHPHLQALLAVVVLVAYEAVHTHVI
jgi:hypothetical protein